MKWQRGFTIIEVFSLAWILLVIAGVIGWIMNVYKFASVLMNDQVLVITGMLVARGIGIFVTPLGAILGYF